MSWLRGDAGASMDAMMPAMALPGLAVGPMTSRMADDSSGRGWRPGAFDAELGYGWAEGPGRPLDVYGAVTGGGAGNVARFGVRTKLGLGLDLGLNLSLELTRAEWAGAAERGIVLRLGSGAPMGAFVPGMAGAAAGCPGGARMSCSDKGNVPL